MLILTLLAKPRRDLLTRISPFPRSKRMHELASEAQQYAKLVEEEKLAPKIIEEAPNETRNIEEIKILEECMFPNCK
jgi:hypothetical protein